MSALSCFKRAVAVFLVSLLVIDNPCTVTGQSSGVEVIGTANIEVDRNTQTYKYDLSGSVPKLTLVLVGREILRLIQEAIGILAEGSFEDLFDIKLPLTNVGMDCIASLDNLNQALSDSLEGTGTPPIVNSFADVGLLPCSTCFFEVDVDGNGDIGTNDVGSDAAIVVNIGTDGVTECGAPSTSPSAALSSSPTIACPETSSSKGMMNIFSSTKSPGKGMTRPRKTRG